MRRARESLKKENIKLEKLKNFAELIVHNLSLDYSFFNVSLC